MKKVYIETNGCAVLRHETYRLAKFFEENDCIQVSTPQDADIIIMTACGVTDGIEKNAIEAIKRLKENCSKGVPFIVSGCLPAISAQEIEKISPDIILCRYEKIADLEKLINAHKSFADVKYNVNPTRHHSFGDPEVVITKEEENDCTLAKILDTKYQTHQITDIFKYSTKGRHLWRDDELFEVRVSYGCPSRCSYCATKKAIGEFKSVPVNEIIPQIEKAIEEGYDKVMLMGDEIGFYGMDISLNIIDLLEALDKYSAKIKIGIRYIHPDIIVRYYKQMEKYFQKGFIFYFCSAFQSGSAHILKLMNRNPNVKEFISCIHDINEKKYPVIKHTQIIIGFPEETDADFMETLTCLKEGGFDYVTMTKFSPRKGTPAYDLENRIPDDIADRRYKFAQDWFNLSRKSRLYDAIKDLLLREENNADL